MRQVFLEKGAVSLKEIAEPILDADHVLVAVYYSFISSGTETATLANAQENVFLSNIPQKITKILESLAKNGIEGTKALIKGRLSGTVQAVGYSCSGKVIAVGEKVTKFRAGDFVACAGAGLANHADIVSVPENLVVKISDEKYLKEASLTTIGAIALQGLRRAQIQLGETVCVVGLGLLGQITVQLAKQAGCTVIGIDPIHERLELAKKLGADKTFDANDKNILTDIAFSTHHLGVDCTIITAASKSNALVQDAMHMTRKKGKVVVVGDVGLHLERSPLYQKEIDFLISCSYGPGRYDTSYEQKGVDYPFAYVRWTENRNMQAFVHLLETKAIRVDDLISDCISIENVSTAYDLLKNKQRLGIVLEYTPYVPLQDKDHSPQTIVLPAKKDIIRVGFIGAGGFAKIKLIPIVSRIKNVKINAIVDADSANSINVSRTYGAAQALTNDIQLFDTDMIDAVVIASPHKYHCQQAITALQNGKAVFMEKPMVTTFEQFNELETFLNNNPSAQFCVDYNRSFSPFIKKIKKALAHRTSPIIAHYRMNAGFIPKDHWVQTEVGAGRIIGEACHIFDLFYYLTDAQPVAVSVEALKPSHDDLFPTDNFSAQISFSDGSICTLLYTSIGHAGLGKEKLELFFDSKSIVMDDYTTLQGFGLPTSFNEKMTTADKGHENLLHEFFTTIQNSHFVPPITFERLTSVAKITLIIDQLACKGGGTNTLLT